MTYNEFKILRVVLKNGHNLLILSKNIIAVENLDEKSCRVYYGNTYVDVDKDLSWFRKHLEKEYDESSCREI